MKNIDALRNLPDEELVKLSLEGRSEGFACLIERYKNLVCSMTYTVVGGVQGSEDLAQEAFVTAWKSLGQLRQPENFKAWLCGITRNLTRNFHRRDNSREKSVEAESEPAITEDPSAVLITREEEQLLWDSLNQIPIEYREPLVLFYREDRSIRQVAEDLALTEEAVRQRLSRGRSMLREQVVEWVESSLPKTRPGKVFTITVLALLPISGAQAGAATFAAASVKASTPLKTAAAVAGSGALLGTVAGLFGAFIGVRASYKAASTEAERKHVIRFTIVVCVAVFLFAGALLSILYIGRGHFSEHPLLLGSLLGGVIVLYVVGLVLAIFRANNRQRQIQMEQGTYNPASDMPLRNQTPRNMFFGLVMGVGGALGWILITTLQKGYWNWFFLTLGIGLLTVIFFQFLILKDRKRAMGYQLIACALMAVWNLFLINYRPGVLLTNIEKTGEWKNTILLAINLFIILLYGAILTSIWLRDRRAASFYKRAQTQQL